MIVKFVKEENIEEVVIGNVVIMLLLYANDVSLFANSLQDAQKLNGILGILSYMTIALKQRLGQNKDKPCIMYNNKPLETMENFK